MVFGTTRIGDDLNPAISSGSTRTSLNVYQGLLFLDSELNPQPELAERFTVEEGGKVYRFSLRKGVKWHDGEPFTSEDVKFTFESMLLEFLPRTRQSLKPRLQSIETPDPQTVVFRLKSPFSAFPQLMTVADAPILPKHVFEGQDPKTNPANIAPVGTGPFRFVSFKKKAEVRLEANPDYFRKPLPYLHELVIREISDSASLIQALERGAIDAIVSAPYGPDLDGLRRKPEVRVVPRYADPALGNCVYVIGFNLDRPLFSDAAFRRAIANGVDRERILNEVFFRYGRVSESPIVSGIEWAHTDKLNYPELDSNAAEDSLTKAGWVAGANGQRISKGVNGVSDETPLRFELLYSSTFVEVSKIAEVFRESLGKVGVEVVATGLDINLLQSRVFEDRSFDTFLSQLCQRTDPEIGLQRSIHSSAILPLPNSNGPAYRNPKVDQLMDQAAAEPDRSERALLYREVQEILTQDLPYLWLVEIDNVGVHVRACGGINFESVDPAEGAFCRR